MCEEPLDPAHAFGLLANETRLAVLRALWATDGPLAFGDLRERVGNPDSGRFNYHLGELVGHFVRHADEGYELRQAGVDVVRAVRAGAVEGRPQLEPTPVDVDCPHCAGSLTVAYDEHAVVRCVDCERVLMWNEFPPAGLANRTPGEILEAFDRWTRWRFRLAFESVCPACAAVTTGSLERSGPDADGTTTATDQDADPTPPFHAGVVCENCRYEAWSPLVAYVRYHPDVAERYAERGVVVDDLPFWAVLPHADDHEEQVVSTDPLRVRVSLDDGRLQLLVDEDLSVAVLQG